MNNDNEAILIRNDSLLVSYGNSLYYQHCCEPNPAPASFLVWVHSVVMHGWLVCIAEHMASFWATDASHSHGIVNWFANREIPKLRLVVRTTSAVTCYQAKVVTQVNAMIRKTGLETADVGQFPKQGINIFHPRAQKSPVDGYAPNLAQP